MFTLPMGYFCMVVPLPPFFFLVLIWGWGGNNHYLVLFKLNLKQKKYAIRIILLLVTVLA